MQDGAPCHTAKKVQQWFDDHPWVTLLDWAPQSPDMNPIENLWTMLAWENLGKRHDALKNLCDSMPSRVAALVESKGGPTKY